MKQIGTDFQGWPICAMNLGEILKRLGFVEDDKAISLQKNEKTEKLLKSYPRLLTDDGMGYGVNPEYVTEVDTEIYDQKIKTIEEKVVSLPPFPQVDTIINEEEISVFNIFRDVPENDVEDE